ncbi:MAG: GNAT family N-acetyltransferase [Oscillibacter sp.]|jgi:GNAT superfamily N-acetyltransferase|nr:GNAT family N-acetyltransferase [Oscillibacter sp.]
MSLKLTPAHREPEEIRPLFQEYTDMILANVPAFRAYLDIQHYDDETAHLERKYGPPEGRLYLARWDGAAAGCAGLRKLDEKCCELKRLYVRPAFRGRQIGKALLLRLIDDARSIGYQHMLLDTLPFMDSALRLYRRFGFHPVPCYNDSPLEETVYLGLEL